MNNLKSHYNKVISGDSLKIMKKLPSESIDVIFADPPYNLQLCKELYRPNKTKVKGVDEEWDKFSSFKAYDRFSEAWLKEAYRLLKPNGTIWVMGTYHNIFRLGKIIQDLDFWILNEITWVKNNPMPNFRGVRFTNGQETLIWASKSSNSKYLFNYNTMKSFNNDLQMTSVWTLPICSGKERLKAEDGSSLHSTQKPMALLYRVILASTNKGDLILDPFFGTGTTGVVAKLLQRNFIGIELDKTYASSAIKRIESTNEIDTKFLKSQPRTPRVTLANLIENGIIPIGTELFNDTHGCKAQVCADGRLLYNGSYFSMNQLAKFFTQESSNNAWLFWSLKIKNKAESISSLRQQYLQQVLDI